MKLGLLPLSGKLPQMNFSLGSLIGKYGALKPHNGEKECNIEDMKIPDNGVHFYIGNFYNDSKGLYDGSFVENSLDVLLNQLPKDTDIHIEMAGGVGQMLDSSIDFVDMQDQIDRVEKAVADISKSQSKRIHVHNIMSRHNKLFEFIQEKGIAGLGDEIGEDAESLYLASLLYKATQSDSRFLDRIKSTKSKKTQAHDIDGKSDHYATLELAIRIQDLLNGISLQGGEAFQQKYDAIISDILDGQYNNSETAKYKPVPELEELHDLFKEAKLDFQRLYFSKQKYQHVLDERKKNKNIGAGIVIGLALLGLLAGKMYNDIQNEREQKKQAVASLLERNFSGRPIGKTQAHLRTVMAEESEKMEVIGWKVDRIIRDFKKIYGAGELTDEQLSDMVLQQFLEMEPSQIPTVDVNSLSGMSSFIEQYFIPGNKIRLMKEGRIDIFRQKYAKQYGDVYFSRNSGIPDDLVQMSPTGVYDYTTSGFKTYQVGSVNCTSVDPSAGIIMSCGKDDVDERLVARSQSSKKYSFEEAKDVAYDYLNNIVVRDLADKINHIFSYLYDVPYVNDRELVNKALIKLIYEEKINISELYSNDFVFLIHFIEEHFSEIIVSQSIYDSIENTLGLDDDTIKSIAESQSKTIATYIGIIPYEGYTPGISLYIYKHNGKKYILSSFGREQYLDSPFSETDLEYAKKAAQQLKELL